MINPPSSATPLAPKLPPRKRQDAEPESEEQQKKKQEKKALEVIVKEASKLKSKYKHGIYEVTELGRLIASEPVWSWANNGVTAAPLQQAQINLDRLIKENPEVSMFTNNEVTDMRGNQDFEAMVKACAVNLAPLVQAVEQEASLLRRMHKARKAS